MMKELKIVLFNENNFPRTFKVTIKFLYRLVGFQAFLLVLLLSGWALVAKLYIKGRSNPALTDPIFLGSNPQTGPSNTIEEQNQFLRDEIDRLNHKISNAGILQKTKQTLENNNPALSLFGSGIIDKIKDQNIVHIKNLRHSVSGDSTNFNFEIHNAATQDLTQKGYIVVVARTEKGLYAYPSVFNNAGPVLIDFEQGESFQVARFRSVNAQFKLSERPFAFQIFLFTRAGELIINTSYEVPSGQ